MKYYIHFTFLLFPNYVSIYDYWYIYNVYYNAYITYRIKTFLTREGYTI